MQKIQFQQYDIMLFLTFKKFAENANVTWLNSEEMIKIFKQKQLTKTCKLQNNYLHYNFWKKVVFMFKKAALIWAKFWNIIVI